MSRLVALHAALIGGAALSLLAAANPALAQDSDAQDDHRDVHLDDQIVVTGALRVSRVDALSSVAVLGEEALVSAVRPSIGETLVRTPGVSASSFGPSASRPVLRGLGGERVRVLSDSLGSIDVSNTSADHASAINPLLAERIEVLRGPQSLQFGSAAIGGVVNVLTRRIPTVVPEKGFHLDAMATYGSAAKERSLGASGEVALADRLVFHLDGSYTKSDDMRIGGYALTPELRAQALQSAESSDSETDPDFAANAAIRGKLPNTAARTWNVGTGLAFIDAGGNIGVAYSRLDNLYGLPVRYATLPGQGQEQPRIHLKQDRFDLRAELTPDEGLFEKLALRAGFADYRHFELEPSGEIGTSFSNQGVEARFEATQRASSGWSGASGLQLTSREFAVSGEEAFLPRNSSRQLGLFTVQQLERGPLKISGGLRYERSVQDSKPFADEPQYFAGSRSFDSLSGALGAVYTVAPGWKLGVNVERTERAPSAEELFANGPHAGTAAFEIGDPLLGKERATSIEGVVRGFVHGLTLELSAYHSWYKGFIYETRTGDIEDGLPVFRIDQGDARFWGFEAHAEVRLAHVGAWDLKAEGIADYVHATIESAGPAPRIPPLRVLGALELHSPRHGLRAEVERATSQDRIAAQETVTPGYTMVNLEASWRPWGDERPLTLLVSANNLFDVDARRHASVLKDYAPLAGRDIRVTARLEI
jgi:iron complex outermembrane receptor protein